MTGIPAFVATCMFAAVAHAQDFSGPYWHEEEPHRAFVCSYEDKTAISLEQLDRGVGLYATISGPQPEVGQSAAEVLALWRPNARARSGYDSTDFDKGMLEIESVAGDVVKGFLTVTLRGQAYRVGFGAKFLGGLPSGINCDAQEKRRYVLKRSWTPATKEAVLNHRVRIGMSADMVRLALGYPLTVRRRETARGDGESWIYRAGLAITFSGSHVSAIDSWQPR